MCYGLYALPAPEPAPEAYTIYCELQVSDYASLLYPAHEQGIIVIHTQPLPLYIYTYII